MPALTARIRFPDGKLVDEYDGSFRLDEVTKSSFGEGSGCQSGTSVPLRWFRLYEEGSITYQLTLPEAHLKSKPVTVSVTNSVASPDAIVFEFESY